jgi:predicted TPR repeat methyltransferase
MMHYPEGGVLGMEAGARLRMWHRHNRSLLVSTHCACAGLGGGCFREMAERLVGVDASPEMLRVAAETEMYDGLHTGDILTELPRITGEEFGGTLYNRRAPFPI